MERTHLSQRQAKLIPEGFISYDAFALAESLSISIGDVYRVTSRPGVTTVWAVSDGAIFIHNLDHSFSKTAKLFIIGIGYLMADGIQDIVEALIRISSLPRDESLAVYAEKLPVDGGFSSGELQQIYAATTHAPIIFYDIDFTEEQAVGLATIQQPISLHLHESFSPRVASTLVRHVIQRKTPFGNLDLHEYYDECIETETQRILKKRRTLLFECLRFSHHRGKESLAIALFQCQFSIGHLVVEFCEWSEDVGQALANSIARGTCPSRLTLKYHGLRSFPGKRNIVEALGSPQCILEEINLFCSRSLVSSFVVAIDNNKSLTKLFFNDQVDCVLWDIQFLQAVAHHPTINTFAFGFQEIPRGSSELLRPLLRRKRHFQIFFEGANQSSSEEWERVIEPAMSFNRFHSGVVDKMPKSERLNLCFQLSLLRCNKDPVRTALLLHQHRAIWLPAMRTKL